MLTATARQILEAVNSRMVADGEAVDCDECFGENLNCSNCGGDGVLAANPDRCFDAQPPNNADLQRQWHPVGSTS